MRKSIVLLCSALWACDPSTSDPSQAGKSEAAEATDLGPGGGAEADDSQGAGSEDAGSEDAESEDAESEDAESEDAEVGDDVEPSGPFIRSGRWTYVDDRFDIIDDPCNWSVLLSTGLAVGAIQKFMPRDFAVEGGLDSFSILAGRYGGSFGAESPVTCEIFDRERFKCETQEVIPVDGYGFPDSLGSLGWLYTVSFEGTVVTPRRIDGTAVVEFQSIDAETQAALDAVGIDFRSCTQVFDLQLGYSPRESE